MRERHWKKIADKVGHAVQTDAMAQRLASGQLMLEQKVRAHEDHIRQ